MIVCLQTIVSRFRDDPGFYNPICVSHRCGASRAVAHQDSALALHSGAGLVCARRRGSTRHAACLSPLLRRAAPHAHRSRLRHALEERWPRGVVRAPAHLGRPSCITGDIFWIAVFHFTHYSYSSALAGMIPAPLILLALGIFYLWIYLRDPHAPPLLPSLTPEPALIAAFSFPWSLPGS